MHFFLISWHWPPCHSISITYPLGALYVLKTNCGPIHSLLCGPAWVTISTWLSQRSSAVSNCFEVLGEFKLLNNGLEDGRGGTISREFGVLNKGHCPLGSTSNSIVVSSQTFSFGTPERCTEGIKSKKMYVVLICGLFNLYRTGLTLLGAEDNSNTSPNLLVIYRYNLYLPLENIKLQGKNADPLTVKDALHKHSQPKV